MPREGRPGARATVKSGRFDLPMPALAYHHSGGLAPPRLAGAPADDVNSPQVGARMATTRKILVVDDESELRQALAEQLALHEEFETETAETAQVAVQKAKNGHFDLVIMDVGLPDMDGREAVKILRKSGFKAPVIMLTGHDADSDTILGLEAGANDYVTKPFRFAVLLARIRAQLRQYEQSEDATFNVGPYVFKPAQKLLLDGDGKK